MKPYYISALLLFFAFSKGFSANHQNQLDSNTCVNAFAVSADYTWIGTADGLLRINKEKNTHKKYTTENSSLPSNQITAICATPDGNIWIGTPKGLVRFDKVFFGLLTTENSGLPDNDITSMALDNENNVWIGTKHGGLVKMHRHFKRYQVYNSSNSLLKNNYILSVSADNEGNVWAGVHNEGLVKINHANWSVINKDNSSLEASNVLFVRKGKDGLYKIGTHEKGVLISDATMKDFKPKEGPENKFLKCHNISYFTNPLWMKYLEEERYYVQH